MKNPTSIVLMMLMFGHGPHALAALQRSDIDIEHYDLEMTLSLDGDYAFQNALEGLATIRFRNVGAASIETVPFVLNRLMRYEKVHDGEGRQLHHSHRLQELENFDYFQANVGSVKLAEPLAPGEVTALHLAFSGRLTGYIGAGMLYTKETLDPDFTILRNEVLAWPMLSGPDWQQVRIGWADEFEWVATFDVPATHKVANGERVQLETRSNRNIYRYHSARPGSFMIFPIAPYTELQVGLNRIFHLTGSETGAKRLAGKMQQAIELFEGWFGPIRSSSGLSLSIIEIPAGYGSQARFPTIIQTADAFNSADEMEQLYHELSHLWQVDMYAPMSPRLEEGLSTFLQSYVDEKLGGSKSLKAFMEEVLDLQKLTYEKNPSYRNIAIADFGREGLTRLSYGVGALFYYELFKVLGERGFLALLRGFYESYREVGADFDTLVEYYRDHTHGEAAKVIEVWLIGTAFTDKILSG